MTTTNYKLEKNRDRFLVKEDGKVVSNGFLNQMDALHSIWVMNREIPTHFYIERDMDVYLIEKSLEEEEE
jgi:hypothetical protein